MSTHNGGRISCGQRVNRAQVAIQQHPVRGAFGSRWSRGETSRDATAVETSFRHIAVLDFPEEAAAPYAEIGAELKSRGDMIGAYDLHRFRRDLGAILWSLRYFGEQ
jgi:hypothetical protein